MPTECATESHASNIAYPFIDRIGDVRFAPRPLATAADAVTIVQPDLDGMLVSAAMMGDRETLLITTYHDILSLNIHSGQVTRLAPDLASLNSKKYVPTGIAIGRRTGSVFLGNYLANNILIGHISTNRVTFEQELSGDRLVFPENVAITPDESWWYRQVSTAAVRPRLHWSAIGTYGSGQRKYLLPMGSRSSAIWSSFLPCSCARS